MGGMILKNKEKWNTSIISLCRRDDPDRAPKFKKVCTLLKAKGSISDLEDEELKEVEMEEVCTRITTFAEKEYDYIFTHGDNGEYGHKRHLDVNRAVNKMMKEKLISGKYLITFSYEKKDGFCYAKQNSDKFIILNKLETDLKKKLIRNLYGFSAGSFEDVCCTDREAFTIKKLGENYGQGEKDQELSLREKVIKIKKIKISTDGKKIKKEFN